MQKFDLTSDFHISQVPKSERSPHIMSLLRALVAVLGGAALGDVGLVDHPFAADSVAYLDGEWQVRD